MSLVPVRLLLSIVTGLVPDFRGPEGQQELCTVHNNMENLVFLRIPVLAIAYSDDLPRVKIFYLSLQ